MIGAVSPLIFIAVIVVSWVFEYGEGGKSDQRMVNYGDSR